MENSEKKKQSNVDLVKRFLPFSLITIFTVFAFFPAIGFKILTAWDDHYYILNNTTRLEFSLENTLSWFQGSFFANYQPLTMLSYTFDYNVFGLWGPGYHIHNIILHILTATGMYYVFKEMGIRSSFSLLGVLIYAVHPQRVESVVWLSERKDVLSGAFYFWGIYFFLRHLKTEKTFSFLTFSFFICSFLSKAMAVSFPFVLLLLIWIKNKKIDMKANILKLWPYFIMLMIMMPVTFLAQKKENGVRPVWDVLHQIKVAVFNQFWYIKKFFYPVNLNPIYPLIEFNHSDIFSLMMMIFIISSIFLFLFKKDKSFFIWTVLPLVAMFIIILAPVCGIVPLGGTDHADRYSYIPTFAIFLFLLLTLERFLKDKDFTQTSNYKLGIPAFIILIFLCLTSYSTTLIWENKKTLFFTAYSSLERPNMVAMDTYANILLDDNRFEEANALAKKILKRNPRSFKGAFISMVYNYKKALFMKDRKMLEKSCQKLLELHKSFPKEPMVYSRLADCFKDLGDLKNAEKFYLKAIKYDKESFSVWLNLGAMQYGLKQFDDAIASFREAIKIKPYDKNAVNNLANTFLKIGKKKEAQDIMNNFNK